MTNKASRRQARARRTGDAMEAEAQRRDLVAVADERPADPAVTITADYAFATALIEGYAAATDAGQEFTNRSRRVIHEVLGAYGTASGAGAPFSGSCVLTHRFCEVALFTFPARGPRREAQPPEDGQCSG